jgi:hypothetical protein
VRETGGSVTQPFRWRSGTAANRLPTPTTVDFVEPAWMEQERGIRAVVRCERFVSVEPCPRRCRTRENEAKAMKIN